MTIASRKLAAATVLLVAALLAAACGTADEAASPPPTGTAASPAASPTEADGERPESVERLRLAGLSRFGYPHPFAFVRGPGWIMAGLIFDSLLWEDSTGEPIPWLATDWEQSDDGLTWTFTLREGATWHDGEPVTADDVAFTVEYMTTGAGADVAGFAGGLEVVDEVVAVDEHTVEFRLSRPHAAFEEDVGQSVLIVPEHIWAGITDPGTQRGPESTIGSGPYILESIDEAAGSLLFTANENFHLGTPYVRRLEFVPVEDELLALQRGEIDVASTPLEEQVPQQQVEVLESDPRFGRLDERGSWNRALHFNLDKGFPYDDVRFRHAVAYALDRQDLVDRVLLERGAPGSSGGLAPAHPWLAQGLPDYARNLDQANALLDEIGMADTDGDGFRELPDGSPFTQELKSSNRFSASTPQLIVEYLREVGIRAELSVLDQAAADEAGATGDYTMSTFGYGGLMGDPDTLRTRYSSQVQSRSFARARGYVNERFETIAAEQLVTVDEAARRQLVEEMQTIVAGDIPILSLYVPDSILFFNQEVFDNWYFTPGCSPCGGTRNKHMYVTGHKVGFEEAAG